MNWGLIHYIALNEHISEELSRMLTTVDVIWYLKICRHCVSSIHRIMGYTQNNICGLEVSPWMYIISPSCSHHDLANHNGMSQLTMTWLTITECHSWPWTFSVVKIMSSCLCLYQARSVQSHNYVLRGYRFYLLVRGWFWILWLFWQCGIFAFHLIPRSWFTTEYVYSQAS
jgi:hypothetical protein